MIRSNFPRVLLVGAMSLPLLFVAVVTAGFGYRHFENEQLVDAWVRSAPLERIDLSRSTYAHLPAPVRRYFDFAFQGQTEVFVSHVSWTEQGDFLLPVGQFTVDGGQISRPQQPIYAWIGSFWKGPLPVIDSRDAFRLDTHDMRARAFGWPKVMHTDYEDPKEIASLYSYLTLRYYGQAPLMPWALLDDTFVHWVARDDMSAWLEIRDPNLAGRYLVTFGKDGSIVRMATDRRLLEGNHTYQSEVGLKLDYALVNGFMVPTRMDYTWTLEDGSVVSHYAFSVSDVVYHGDAGLPEQVASASER